MTEPIEIFFLRYSLPCTHYFYILGKKNSQEQQQALFSMREKVSSALHKPLPKEDYKMLELMVLNNISPSRKELQSLYPNAVKRLGELFPGRDIWEEEVIKDYWRKSHANIIDQESKSNPAARSMRFNGGTESINDLCRTNIATVVSTNKQSAIVEYYSRKGELVKRKVSKAIVQDLNIGDKVRIHYWYATERAA